MARTLPSSSIWARSHSLEPMSPTGIDPPPPPCKKQKPPHSLLENYKPWPLPPSFRESWVAALASMLSSPRFGFMRMEEAEVITKKIEDEACKAADAAADISLEERESMYTDLMFTQIGKYRLSESEFFAKLISDPRYTSNWRAFQYYDPGMPWDTALWTPQKYDQAQVLAEWLAYQDSRMSSQESLEAIQVISSEQHAPSCVTTSSQQRQDSGMSSQESLEAIQVISSEQAQLQTSHAPSCITTSSQQRQDSGMSSQESLEAIQVISSEQAQLQTSHAPSCITTSSQQRQDSGMSSQESLEAIQGILSDKGKLGQVLLQHPNLLKVLQEKLEQQ